MARARAAAARRESLRAGNRAVVVPTEWAIDWLLLFHAHGNATLDAATRTAILQLDDLLDRELAMRAWEAALAAPVWDRKPVWLHCDLLAGNVLVHQGRVTEVIDFGALGVGDPACELVIA